MLWSRPSRAQPPIVEVVKWTLAAARMACASVRVIQSAAEGIGQSDGLARDFDEAPDFDGFAGPADDDGSVVPAPAGTAASPASDVEPGSAGDPFSDVVELSVEPSSPLPDEAPDRAAARRSFFAQPDPLKWTDGAEIAFLTGPLPHRGHAAGGSAWTPWITSNRRPQAAQS
jgi:hypothetical protein